MNRGDELIVREKKERQEHLRYIQETQYPSDPSRMSGEAFAQVLDGVLRPSGWRSTE